MSYEHISVSLPRGYAQSLDEESSRYGLNRSELIHVLCDGYFYVTAGREITSKTFFPDVLPHRREEADQWLDEYLRLVIRIPRGSGEAKTEDGEC